MDHKKLLLAGALALTVLLSACGEPQSSVQPSEEQPDTSSPVEITSPSAEPSDSAAPSDSAPVTESAAEPSAPDADLKELAMTFIDKSVEELIAAIGEPTGSDYAPSCLGSGEDGELFYDGFSVYTYREGDTETVTDVL